MVSGWCKFNLLDQDHVQVHFVRLTKAPKRSRKPPVAASHAKRNLIATLRRRSADASAQRASHNAHHEFRTSLFSLSPSFHQSSLPRLHHNQYQAMKSAVVASIALIVTATQAAPMRKRNLAPQHKSLNAPEERIQSDEAYDPFMGMKDRKLAGHVGSMPHGHEEGEEHHESMSMSMKPSEPVPTEAPSRCVEQVEVPTTHAAKQSCLAETVKTRCGTPTSPLEPPITIPVNLTRSFSSHQCFNGRNVRCVCPGCRRHVPVSVMRHFWLKVLQRLDVDTYRRTCSSQGCC